MVLVILIVEILLIIFDVKVVVDVGWVWCVWFDLGSGMLCLVIECVSCVEVE